MHETIQTQIRMHGFSARKIVSISVGGIVFSVHTQHDMHSMWQSLLASSSLAETVSVYFKGAIGCLWIEIAPSVTRKQTWQPFLGTCKGILGGPLIRLSKSTSENSPDIVKLDWKTMREWAQKSGNCETAAALPTTDTQGHHELPILNRGLLACWWVPLAFLSRSLFLSLSLFLLAVFPIQH